jgi:hypothetical protein
MVGRIVHCWRKTGYLSEADQRRRTCALQNMRMSRNTTYLLDPSGCRPLWIASSR